MITDPLTRQLANALATLCKNAKDDDGCIVVNALDFGVAEEALVAYNLHDSRQQATDFRVQWEIDTFNATTPVEAAQEAWAHMRREDSAATCFTVIAKDGTVTQVDLVDE